MEKVEVTPVVGLPQLTGWSHVVVNQSRTISFAVAISGQHASNVGRDLVDELENLSSESVAALYTSLARFQRDVIEKNCVLHLAAAVVSEGKGVYLATNAMIILHRQGKLGKILQAGETLQVIEGQWLAEDLFILLTEPAVALFNEIEQKISQGYEDDVVITSLVPSVHSLDNSSLYALAFVRKVEVQIREVAPVEEVAAEPEFTIAVDLDTAGPIPEEPNIALLPSAPVVRPRRSFIDTLKPLVHSFKQRVSSLPRPFSREVYVSSFSGRSFVRSFLLIGLPLLLVLGGASYYFYQRQSARSQVQTQLDSFWAQIQVSKAEAVTDPVVAREKMQTTLSAMQELKKNSSQRYGIPSLIETKITEVEQEYQAISGLEALDALEQFFDLRYVASDFIATKIVSTEEGLAFLDEGKKQVISLTLPNKQYTTLDLSQREVVRDIIATESDFMVLGDGVFIYPSEGDSEQIIANDEQVKTASNLLAFNDAFYILNPEKQNIFRYRPNEEEKYEVAVGWVKPGEAIDFTQLQSFAIDGDIWVSTRDGKIYRYNSGAQENFEPIGLQTPFSHPLWLITSEESDKLYILEPNNRRVVILTKDGTFLKEIQNSSLSTATGFTISEDETKAYVISGSLVYEIPL